MNIDIGIDCDGVITHTNEKLIQWAKERFDIDIQLEDITEFDITKILPRGDELMEFYFEPSFYEDLMPREGAREVIDRLMEDGDDVVVITALPAECVPTRTAWFKKYMPSFNARNIMYCNRKDKFYAKVLLDDALHNLDTTIVDYPILFARPWNAAGRDRFVTVYSWDEFYQVIGLIKQGLSYEELKQSMNELAS